MSPLPLGEGASGKVVFFELAVQCGEANIQNAGGNLPIASMPLQRLYNSLSFNLGEGSGVFNVNSTTFGRVGSTFAARIIQFGARFDF